MAAVLLGVFAALCWAVMDLFVRTMALRIGPFRMGVLVMIAGAVPLAAFAAYTGKISGASQAGLLLSVGLGLTYGLGVAGLFKAFSLGPISLVVSLTAAYPVFVLLWGWFNGLNPTALQWSAAAAALSGAVIVARAGGEDNASRRMSRAAFLTMVFFCLLSSLGYAASVVFGQHAAVSIGEIEATLISRPISVLAILPFCIGEARPVALTRRLWAGVFIMGALDVAGMVAINGAGHLPGREFASVGVSSYGAIAVILAMIFLKEKVLSGQWLGIALIVTGVATLSVSQ